MKRGKMFLLFLSVILGICVSSGAKEIYAAGQFPELEGWVQDEALLLTSEEEKMLEQECERIFKEHQTGVYVVTTRNFGSGDIKEWQRQIFDEYDYDAACGGNSVMLAISMAERDWGLVAFGTAQDAFSVYGRERIGELILDDLSEGEFYAAFSRFTSISEDYLTAAEAGKPYTEKHKYGEGFRIPAIIAVSFILSLLISLVIVFSWKKSMNTRVRQSGAMAYLKEGSFRLYNQTDQFLYHRVSRTKRQKESLSGSGSSGTVHSDRSGTSGKF